MTEDRQFDASAPSPGKSTEPANENDGAIQRHGQLAVVRIGLAEEVRHSSVATLNRMLAHALALRDSYIKIHTLGEARSPLQWLLNHHAAEQATLIDALAERVKTLGGVAVALAQDVADESPISRAPRGREHISDAIARLLDAHELILKEVRILAREAGEKGDEGTHSLLVSAIIRTNESQSMRLGESMQPDKRTLPEES